MLLGQSLAPTHASALLPAGSDRERSSASTQADLPAAKESSQGVGTFPSSQRSPQGAGPVPSLTDSFFPLSYCITWTFIALFVV